MAKNEEKKKRSGGKAAGVAALILLLAGGGWFGLGGGRGLLPGGEGAGSGGSLLPGTQQVQTVDAAQSAESAAPPEESAAPAEHANVLAIRVSENFVTLNGEEYSLEALEQALLSDYTEGMEVTLTDDHAIKAAYDSVAALLDRLDIPYNEK